MEMQGQRSVGRSWSRFAFWLRCATVVPNITALVLMVSAGNEWNAM